MHLYSYLKLEFEVGSSSGKKKIEHRKSQKNMIKNKSNKNSRSKTTFGNLGPIDTQNKTLNIVLFQLR